MKKIPKNPVAPRPGKTEKRPRGRPRVRPAGTGTIVAWSTDSERLSALDDWAGARGLSRSTALDAAVDALIRRG
jgi:hypothetical protein